MFVLKDVLFIAYEPFPELHVNCMKVFQNGPRCLMYIALRIRLLCFYSFVVDYLKFIDLIACSLDENVSYIVNVVRFCTVLNYYIPKMTVTLCVHYTYTFQAHEIHSLIIGCFVCRRKIWGREWGTCAPNNFIDDVIH